MGLDSFWISTAALLGCSQQQGCCREGETKGHLRPCGMYKYYTSTPLLYRQHTGTVQLYAAVRTGELHEDHMCTSRCMGGHTGGAVRW